MKKVLALLLACCLMIGCFAGCGNNTNSSAPANSGTQSTTSTPAESGGAEPTNVSTGPADTSEKYSFTVYYNYTGWNKTFGLDEYSKFLCDKFNIEVNWYGPDSDPDAKLNLMVSSDDLPESIILDRGPNLNKIARGGYLQDLQQYMYEGNTFEQDIAEGTRELLKIDGGLYGVPNWARKGATGGNYQWIINTSTYEAVGSPDLKTVEDLHAYATAVKEAGLKTASGEDVYPFWCTNTDNGYYVYQPFYRATGAPNIVESYFTQEDSKIQYCLESEKFITALKEANKWFNEGLFTAEVFTDNGDQFLAKVTNARPALMWYDYSQDNTNNFRRIVRQNSNNEVSYELLGYDICPDSMQFPGLDDSITVTYGDEAGTVGWNVNCITKKATDPQRIFDLWTYMITPEGSLYMQYGPEGGTLLESVDWSGDLPMPVLKNPNFTAEESDAAGAWFWSQPAQSDYVDGIKFALNDTLPEDQQDWVVTRQAHLSTYTADDPKIGQKFATDENTGLTDTIDPVSDLGTAFQSLKDYSKEMLPKIIMAKDDAEFDSLVQQTLDYVKSTGKSDEVCAKFQEKHDANIAAQGYSAYSDEYDVYHLNK